MASPVTSKVVEDISCEPPLWFLQFLEKYQRDMDVLSGCITSMVQSFPQTVPTPSIQLLSIDSPITSNVGDDVNSQPPVWFLQFLERYRRDMTALLSRLPPDACFSLSATAAMPSLTELPTTTQTFPQVVPEEFVEHHLEESFSFLPTLSSEQDSTTAIMPCLAEMPSAAQPLPQYSSVVSGYTHHEPVVSVFKWPIFFVSWPVTHKPSRLFLCNSPEFLVFSISKLFLPSTPAGTITCAINAPFSWFLIRLFFALRGLFDKSLFIVFGLSFIFVCSRSLINRCSVFYAAGMSNFFFLGKN